MIGNDDAVVIIFERRSYQFFHTTIHDFRSAHCRFEIACVAHHIRICKIEANKIRLV